jgi:hypothetical protein
MARLVLQHTTNSMNAADTIDLFLEKRMVATPTYDTGVNTSVITLAKSALCGKKLPVVERSRTRSTRCAGDASIVESPPMTLRPYLGRAGLHDRYWRVLLMYIYTPLEQAAWRAECLGKCPNCVRCLEEGIEPIA